MRYWGYLFAKIVVACALILSMWHGLHLLLPQRTSFLRSHPESFNHDLGYTMVFLFFFLICCGIAYIVIWDQRYRCRTCLRRLRMPVRAGSWPNMLLLGRPRTEYICLYGHGTLQVPEVQITDKGSSWQRHESIWKELESLEETEK